MTRRVPDKHIADVARAFRDYPDGFRQEFVLQWPDLYFAVSRLVAHYKVTRQRPRCWSSSRPVLRTPSKWECAHAARKYVGQDDTHMFWRCLHCPDMKTEAKR